MMKSKRFQVGRVLAALTLAACMLAQSGAAEGWTNDFEKAREQAKAEKKSLLLDFTGSDWCGWCIKLRKEVFEKDAFSKHVSELFVPVEVDFPQDSSFISDATRTQNEALQLRYGIKGYPTLILADGEGRPFAQTGYEPIGAEAYWAHLQKLNKVRVDRDAALERAAAAQGLEKAKALKEALSFIPEDFVAGHYASVLEEIRGLDPSDTLGLSARYGFDVATREFFNRVNARKSEGGEVLLKLAEEFVAAHPAADAERKQKVLLEVLSLMNPPKDNAAALRLTDATAALKPDSETGKLATQISARIRKMIEGGK